MSRRLVDSPLPPPPPVNVHDPVPPDLSFETVIRIDNRDMRICARDLKSLRVIGRGQYSRVEKTVHAPSGRMFAVKAISVCQDHVPQSLIKRDLEVARNTECSCLVMCYGGLFYQSEVLVLLELMDMSLEDLRTKVYGSGDFIPEELLAYMFHRVVTGLEYLHRERHIMHRDVKPSNLLTDRAGSVKVCDFGISGELIQSFASSNVGSTRYLAPERIDPPDDPRFFIQSDVWSLGVSVVELSTGQRCYMDEANLFHQMLAIVQGDPPRLPENDRFSDKLQYFVNRCLVKMPLNRANYAELLNTDFLRDVDIVAGQKKMASFLRPYLSSDQ